MAEEIKRSQKHRVAIFFGYNGDGYCGLQFDTKVPTIEFEIIKACIATKMLLPTNDTPQKVGLNRAARTDKGVHAVKNVLSLKIMFPNKIAAIDLVDLINKELPSNIRVWGILYIFYFISRYYRNYR